MDLEFNRFVCHQRVVTTPVPCTTVRNPYLRAPPPVSALRSSILPEVTTQPPSYLPGHGSLNVPMSSRPTTMSSTLSHTPLSTVTNNENSRVACNLQRTAPHVPSNSNFHCTNQRIPAPKNPYLKKG